MTRSACLFLLAIAVTFSVTTARAQNLRTRTALPHWASAEKSLWSGYLRYKGLTDYADDREPRAFTQSFSAGTKYQFSSAWSFSAEGSLRMETVNGQIEKDPQETHFETLNPSIAFEFDYDRSFNETHSYTLFAHGEPLFDEPSRMEGYKAIGGFGAALNLGFFKKRYTLMQVIDISELMNEFEQDLSGDPNPDMYYTYKMVHTVQIFRTTKAYYAFGLKLTRYLDASTRYTYSNTLGVAHTWRQFSFALTYDNGGFTDDGSVSLWYLDQYRRLFGLSMGMAF